MTAIAWWTSDSILIIRLVHLRNRLLSLLFSTALAVPDLVVLEDFVGCTRRDGLVDRLAAAARAAIFDLVLLAGAAAPAATRTFTRLFFARLLLFFWFRCLLRSWTASDYCARAARTCISR